MKQQLNQNHYRPLVDKMRLSRHEVEEAWQFKIFRTVNIVIFFYLFQNVLLNLLSRYFTINSKYLPFWTWFVFTKGLFIDFWFSTFNSKISKTWKSKYFRINFKKGGIQRSGDLKWIQRDIFSFPFSHLGCGVKGKGIFSHLGTSYDPSNYFIDENIWFHSKKILQLLEYIRRVFSSNNFLKSQITLVQSQVNEAFSSNWTFIHRTVSLNSLRLKYSMV